mmetsp:Transcript_43952/g.88664  ORF Transcript_43952/g.88664 Transcript_43952/m.88664 type:complete len:235 (-) Transcript_43952:665-1369(-)
MPFHGSGSAHQRGDVAVDQRSVRLLLAGARAQGEALEPRAHGVPLPVPVPEGQHEEATERAEREPLGAVETAVHLEQHRQELRGVADRHAQDEHQGCDCGYDVHARGGVEGQEVGELVDGPQSPEVHVGVHGHHRVGVAQESTKLLDAPPLDIRVFLVDAGLVKKDGDLRHRTVGREEGEEEQRPGGCPASHAQRIRGLRHTIRGRQPRDGEGDDGHQDREGHTHSRQQVEVHH